MHIAIFKYKANQVLTNLEHSTTEPSQRLRSLTLRWKCRSMIISLSQGWKKAFLMLL